MRRAYILTFASEFIVLGTGALVFWVAARYWSTTEFAEYVLARRTLSLLHLPCAIGLGLSVPRYVARAQAQPGTITDPFFLAALALAAGPLTLLGALFVAAPSAWAALFFGSREYTALLPGLYLATVGLILHVIVYGYLRGHLRMAAANCLQLIMYGVIPLGAFLIPDLSVGAAVLLVGASWIAVPAICAAVIALREWHRTRNAAAIPVAARELLRYGLPRLPGDFALSALFTLPATLTAHFSGIEAAGYVAFGISALNLLGGLFSPVGLVLLPAATVMQARGEHVDLRRSVFRLVWVSAVLALAATVVVEITAPVLVRWYLGPQFFPAVAILRVLMLATVPNVVHLVLRGPIDALSIRAYNARNLVLGLGTFAVGAILAPSTIGIALSLTVGILVLGVMTVWNASSLLGTPDPAIAR